MKRKACLIVASLLFALIVYFVGSGFMKVSSAYIREYRLSPDGREITIRVNNTNSAGAIRQLSVHQQEGGKLYLDCYSAFGGFHGTIGAKDEYTITLHDDTELVAIYRSTNCYEEVLRKNASGEWYRVQ